MEMEKKTTCCRCTAPGKYNRKADKYNVQWYCQTHAPEDVRRFQKAAMSAMLRGEGVRRHRKQAEAEIRAEHSTLDLDGGSQGSIGGSNHGTLSLTDDTPAAVPEAESVPAGY